MTVAELAPCASGRDREAADRRGEGGSGGVTCRLCGRTPESRGDQVSPAAPAYTCSRCLILGRAAPAANTVVAGRGISASEKTTNPTACGSDIPGQPGIYVVRAGERYKIGCSSDPDRRARQLRGALLDWVPVPFHFDLVEARVHQHFALKRIQGEWFSMAAEDLAAFEKIVRESIAEIGQTHPLALQRRRSGRPALPPAERRAHERDRKRRLRSKGQSAP